MIVRSSPSPASRRLRLALVALALLLQWTAVPLHLASHGHLGLPLVGGHGPHAHGGDHELAGARRPHDHEHDHGHDGSAGASACEEGHEPESHEPHALEDHLLSLAEPGTEVLQPLILGLVLERIQGRLKSSRVAWTNSVLEDDPRPPPELGRQPARAPPRLA